MHFVIFESDKKYVSKCKEIIFSVMSSSKISYDSLQIGEYGNKEELYLKKLKGNKVYICGDILNKNGFEIAKEIRQNGDWNSPLIIVTDHNEFRNICFSSKLLTLDYIFKDNDVDKNLFDALSVAFKINSCCSCLCVAKNCELYQISYDDIFYVEKRLNENYSTIVTENGEYLVKKSIVSLYKELGNRNFYKTHRSCIVNINKIMMVDFDKNIVKFKNKQTYLISRANKKGLKQILELK